MIPEIWCGADEWTDIWSDRRKKWYIEVGAQLQKLTEWNPLGMKKNTIVNQIALSKLWYVAQIYTFPKFIKDKIEKTIAQLSIWKCALGILDIDTQLNSLELQWI